MAAALFSSACWSTHRALDQADFAPPDPREGVVFGTILIRAPEPEGSSSFASGEGYRSSGASYRIEVAMPRTNQFFAPDTYELEISPGEERFFAAKLPAGEYALARIVRLEWPFPQADPGIALTVQPERIAYVGRLIVALPARIAGPRAAPYSLLVEDDGTAAARELGARHPALASRLENGPLWSVDRWTRNGQFTVESTPPPASPP